MVELKSPTSSSYFLWQEVVLHFFMHQKSWISCKLPTLTRRSVFKLFRTPWRFVLHHVCPCVWVCLNIQSLSLNLGASLKIHALYNFVHSQASNIPTFMWIWCSFYNVITESQNWTINVRPLCIQLLLMRESRELLLLVSYWSRTTLI